MVPHKTPYIFKYLWPGSLWKVSGARNSIFLTFDDGPIPELTDWVLQILKEYGAKATFFCVGDNVEKCPEVFLRIKEEGHSIGNHTFNHLNGSKEKAKVYQNNVLECDHAFQKLKVNTNLFRPPYGRLKPSQRHNLKDRKIVMWDVLTKDYDQNLDPDTILKNSIKATSSGSIVVFHDNVKAEKNLKEVLPKYIEHFQSKGYQFDAL